MEPKITMTSENKETLTKFSRVPICILPMSIEIARFNRVLSNTGIKQAMMYNVNLDFLLSSNSFKSIPPSTIDV